MLFRKLTTIAQSLTTGLSVLIRDTMAISPVERCGVSTKMDDSYRQPGNLLFELRRTDEIFIPRILILWLQDDEIFAPGFYFWNGKS
jgi:hypothetical protein